ncbi:hypothetical protein AQUCO_01500013v1 [Aquilegia coerulea]|uniref:Uncharacterized protein n=1 Tax=Aquilegia coerulea TaxID=218851 RepID=A0A2G5DRP7_AQUCA|nr:hypothetical protein AQUCO_01500013v1 [Aquilegia coerulea]
MTKFLGRQCVAVILVLFVTGAMAAVSRQKVTCSKRSSKCFLKSITCPSQCPQVKPTNSPGAACFDPRFIGGDGIVFYFHGRSNEHFSLISDQNLQINARFIGHRPTGRTRDYTWIKALGLMFGSHTFSNGSPRPEEELKVERTSNKNSVTVSLSDFAEISINVVPITEQDDKIHNYQIPSDDCFAHLEVQFRFIGLSTEVEAKPGVAMAVVGGEDKYRTTSLVSSDCAFCMFSPAGVETKENSLVMDYGTLDCGGNGGNGIVCRK